MSEPTEVEIKPGWWLEKDDDGDWVLNAPPDVIIFSTPGEGLLIGRCTLAEAMVDVEREMRAMGEWP